MKILKCKITGKEFGDIENKSGHITEHLKTININVPTSYLRRQFLKNEGKMWHLQYFDILELQELITEKKKCKYCEWETVDLENKSGQYTIHLLNTHNKKLENYIIDFPEEKKLFKTYFEKLQHKLEIENDINKQIECKICKEKFLKITNTHLLEKHNITLFEYKLNYSEKTASNSTLALQREIFNKGLRMYEPIFTSGGHNEIINFLNENKIEFRVNDKKELKGTELDIFIADEKIAIEYNGLLYHSESYGKKQRSFHLNKTRMSEENNIKLIHIFEDEWLFKKEIVKMKLKHLLNINKSSTIHARKCIIKEISVQIKNVFLDENHIQGADNSTVIFGAYFNEELISVMTFDNKRKMILRNNDTDSYELTRFSTKICYKVPGIAGKLLKFFINNYKPKSIISFADKCWTINKEDNLYTKLNFKLKKEIGPDYKYFNPKISRNRRLHKFSFGKSSLKIKFPEIYSDSKTEWEIMQEAGYDRIWDCGKFKYEMIL